MSVTEPPIFITRGKLRAAARALIALAATEERVEPAQVHDAFVRAGVSRRSAKTPGVRPAEPHKPRRNNDPPDDSGDVRLPPKTGPPPEPIWVRPATGARLAGIGLTLFNRWIAEGRVISKKVRGVRLVLVESIRDIAGDETPTARPGPYAHRIRKERAEQEE